MNYPNGVVWIQSILLVFILVSPLYAKEKTETGLTFLEPPAARPAGLGEAFSAVSNDVTAFFYNPSLLHSLQTQQAHFFYQKGLIDDEFGQVSWGRPFSNGGVGINIGYYNGGTILIPDNSGARNVSAQKDLTIGLGIARKYGSVAFGLTGKYLSSELAELDKASAIAGDIGMTYDVRPYFQLGASIQNMGTPLKFQEVGEDLPRIARVGAAFHLIPHRTMFLLDIPYHFNLLEVQPAVGIETHFGLLAVRVGYKKGSEMDKYSLGTGFLLGTTSIDYAFGLIDELNSLHRFSMTFRFGTKQEPKNPISQIKLKENLDEVGIIRRGFGEGKIDLGESPTITFPEQGENQ